MHTNRWSRSVLLGALLVVSGLARAASAQSSRTDPSESPLRFLYAKTFFQTNMARDPRIAFATDAVVLHRHGEPLEPLTRNLHSWKVDGTPVGRMFFADSDAQNAYWKGKWDGTPHEDEVERNRAGEVVLCAGVRPYMLPTEGWIRHLEEMTDHSITAGADAILPEEPLAHLYTGYEEAFAPLWEKRYGQPWRGQHTSQEARYLTGQLKSELYAHLEQRLVDRVEQRERELGRTIDFVLPIHSLYSNMAGQLVAPLGSSLAIEGIDGYVGQIWTGPVNWARHNFDGNYATFFASAYALYDYFTELVVGTDRKLWLLVDPVEDDPNHTWAEFEQWYRHCVVAALMMEEVDAYEVMPWPDRIFMPGGSTGGGTPAPEHYRTMILSVMQVMQDIPLGGVWMHGNQPAPADQPIIGVAVADSLMWELEPAPRLGPVYGQLIPLIQAGVPVRACVLERMGDPTYRAGFDVILLSYEPFKPTSPAMNTHLAAWVSSGGALIVYGANDALDDADLWWKDDDHATPLDDLFAQLDLKHEEGLHRVGDGVVIRDKITPREFVHDEIAERALWSPLQRALKATGRPPVHRPGYFHMRRGPYELVHAFSKPVDLEGEFVDVFDPTLKTMRACRVAPGDTALLKRVTFDRSAAIRPGIPIDLSPVLHSTHLRMQVTMSAEGDQPNPHRWTITMKGPLGTPGVLRLCAFGVPWKRITMSSLDAPIRPEDVVDEHGTYGITFPNVPEGVVIELE